MKKNIYFIISSLAGGGAERVFVNLVKGIDKSKFDVTLIYLSDERNVYEVPNTIKTINLNTNRAIKSPLKLLRLIRRGNPDCIISTQTHINLILLILKNFFHKKTKLIIRQTSIISLSNQKGLMGKIYIKITGKLYKKADKVICQSAYMKNDLLKFTEVHRNKVVEIFNPVDIDFIKEKAQEETVKINNNYKNIFYVGRIDEVKGLSSIVDAFEQYQKKNKKSKLYLLGIGPIESDLKKYIKEKNLNEFIVFLGFQQNPYKWLKNADLFVMASKQEGMPNALIEAISLKIPVLVQKHPGGTIDILKSVGLEKRFVDRLIIKEESFNKYPENVTIKLERYFGIQNILRKYESEILNVIQ